MSTLDLLILAVLAVGLVRGFATGVIRQVASLVGMVAAFVLGVQLMKPVGGLIVGSLGVSPAIAPLLGFLLVFVVVQVGVFAAGRFVETLVGALRLTVFNRAAGGALGAFKAALALSVGFLVLGYVNMPAEATQRDSALYAPVATVLPTAWNYVSDRLPAAESLSEKFGDRVEASLPGAEE